MLLLVVIKVQVRLLVDEELGETEVNQIDLTVVVIQDFQVLTKVPLLLLQSVL